MDRESKYILRKIILDFLCLFIVGFPILLFFLFGQPYERGFYCDDESIRHPYKDSTISSAVLYVVGMVLPISSMLLIEYIHYQRTNNHVTRTLFGRNIHPWVWNCYKIIGVFGFGMACSQLTTDIAKYTVGRLRPHFFAVCMPDVDCLKDENKFRYIETFRCKNTDRHRLKDMRLSFPSGHSSFSAYTMIYLVIYLQARFTWQGSKLLRHFIQYLCFMMAVGTGLSRISDYKHHWSDVLIGSLQGALVAVLVAVFVSDLFTAQRPGLTVVTETDGDPPSQSGNSATNRIC
ncbi:putative phosphatidate phosphatase [Periplaneta americana]|uniref:putative phosphatidate phosphatase n=1 Tax=Periplaneta americana TaxID=6978 RepID=UPI0037E8A6B7